MDEGLSFLSEHNYFAYFILDELDQLFTTVENASVRHEILGELACLGSHNNGTTFTLL